MIKYTSWALIEANSRNLLEAADLLIHINSREKLFTPSCFQPSAPPLPPCVCVCEKLTMCLLFIHRLLAGRCGMSYQWSLMVFPIPHIPERFVHPSPKLTFIKKHIPLKTLTSFHPDKTWLEGKPFAKDPFKNLLLNFLLLGPISSRK